MLSSIKTFFAKEDKMDDGLKQPSGVSDQNANIAQLTESHPFLHGLRNRPIDKDAEVNQLRNWLNKQPHLPHLTENHLYLFLHSNYYDVEATQEAIDAYFTIRTTSPELFGNKAIFGHSVSNVWNLTNMITLADTTPEGYKTLVYRLVDYDASKLTFNDALKAFFLFNDIRLSEDGLCPGYIVVLDMKGINLAHLAKCNLSSIRKFMNYIQEGHPARLKGVHVINSVSFMDRILALVRPLMKSGLIKLLSIHGSDLTNLFKIVPREMWPLEYGGDAESAQITHDTHKKMIEKNYEKWVDEEELFVMDASKRPKQYKKPCFISNSFKSLQID